MFDLRGEENRESRKFKFKCYRCSKGWGALKGRILKGLEIPSTKFLTAIKLIEFDFSV